MKTVAIFSKPSHEQVGEVAPKLVEWLRARKYRVLADPDTARHVSGAEKIERQQTADNKPDFVIVLGGDGTMLAAARSLAKAGVPILGVNLGALGFLTEVRREELYPTLEALEQNKVVTEVRTMLHCQLVRGDSCAGDFEALNDVVVNQSAMARVADFEVSVDGTFVARYIADGLIVATPTGSTAYSLAAGGPILAPNLAGLAITPVSPHALTNRPLVVPDSSIITIEVKSTPVGAYLTVDGQTGVNVGDGDRIVCKKSQHQVKLLKMAERTFFDVLRTKLKWGTR